MFLTKIFEGPFLKTIAWFITSFSILLFPVPSKADLTGCRKAIIVLVGLILGWMVLDSKGAINSLNFLYPIFTIVASHILIIILLLILLSILSSLKIQ